MQTIAQKENKVIRDARISLSSSLPIPTIVTYLIIFLFLYCFFSGLTYKFYASILFFFYGLIKRMWIAVVCLGLFQALLMIPLRIINLKISDHVNEFKEKMKQVKNENDQSFLVKQKIHRGNRPMLFYTVDFVIQLTLYISIGRLFLTNFYTTPINPKLLFSFIPYPDYPIRSTIFKIPYPWFSHTVDLGIGAILLIWSIIILIQFAIYAFRFIKRKEETQANKSQLTKPQNQIQKYSKHLKRMNGNIVVLLFISWILIRNFPLGWNLRVFSGNISVPNRTFNTITAVATFGTLLWFGTNKIARKSRKAEAQNVDKDIIFETQKAMFKETIKSATLVGLGAYFITRQIPSAFELSIFTFELIALLSPFTLDKFFQSAI